MVFKYVTFSWENVCNFHQTLKVGCDLLSYTSPFPQKVKNPAPEFSLD